MLVPPQKRQRKRQRGNRRAQSHFVHVAIHQTDAVPGTEASRLSYLFVKRANPQARLDKSAKIAKGRHLPPECVRNVDPLTLRFKTNQMVKNPFPSRSN